MTRHHWCKAADTFKILALACGLSACASGSQAPRAPAAARPMEFIRVSPDGRHFAGADSGARFTAWGFNYDHDASGRLLEDYWAGEWPTVAGDFREMKSLGANVVRVHLQFGRFMRSADAPDPAALAQLARLLRLAEETGLRLDLTGLGCYHRQDVPSWYAALGETERWAAQARFWESVTGACAASPAVFCYDLMNEPILPGGDKKETDWLAGELGGMWFVQRLTLDLAGRTREQVAKQWVERMVAGIRKRDKRHMVTVGVIPWALVFPGAKPIFYSKEAGAKLDYASVHFYPKHGEVDKALKALAVYQVGKPLVIEEMFPLACSVPELDAFIKGSRELADGWIGFYWGRMPEEYARDTNNISSAITRGWLEYFRTSAPPRAVESGPGAAKK